MLPALCFIDCNEPIDVTNAINAERSWLQAPC
jgi:hypothetical protein